jgi:hypothetical protein
VGVASAVLAAAVALSIYGVSASLGRWTQDMFAGATFPRESTEPGLRPLRWGQPTAHEDYVIPEEDVVSLLAFLREADANFFVFPDFTICYGLLSKPSPQPLLYFQERITYPLDYDAALDQWIVDDLERNRVEIIVIEARSWLPGTAHRLRAFPRLVTYIGERFTRVRRIGIFIVYQRR